MSKNKKMILSISLLIILIIAVIGISYAAFNYIRIGEKVNQITTGTISMQYAESDNIISINNALPTRDETGKVRLKDGEYFDFSVTTNLSGTATIDFEIAAEDLKDNTFDGANVKFYLTKLIGSQEVEVSSFLPAVYHENLVENKNTGRPSNMMSLFVGSTSTQGEETTNYRLRLYVDESYNPQGDGGNLVFKTRINVYGKVSTDTKELPVMKTYKNLEKIDYHSDTYKKKVTSVIVKNDKNIPSTAIEVENGKGNYFDVSDAKDDSVIAYLEDDENGGYKVTIGGDGGVASHANLSYLFYDFSGLKNVDLNLLDTSNVTDMKNMFTRCSSLTNIAIDNFNTSKVIDINSMFSGCSSLTDLNLSSFDTSSVTNMASMFSGCSNLGTLNISKFDTLNVIDMQNLFRECTKLASIETSRFNTTNVTNMASMFYGCEALTELDVSNFNTENVTNMSYMFYDVEKVSNLDVSHFDTSNVTTMERMFGYCASLTTLDLTSFNTAAVTNMTYMFFWDENLAEILVSSNWNTSNATTTSMFSFCKTTRVTVV